MKKARKGFTLVELLIIVVVIGILTSMMAISSNEAVTTAKANNIISNLRNFVTATNEYYVDSLDTWYTTDAANAPKIALISKYMNKGVSDNTTAPENKLSNYYVSVATGSTSYAERDWFVGYQFPVSGVGATETAAIKAKLAGRAKTIGLYGSAATTTAPSAAFTAEAVIWMKAHEGTTR